MGRARRVVLNILAVVVLLTIAALAALPPAIMGPMINMHVDFKSTVAAADYGLTADRLTLTTEDELAIAAYEVKVKQPKAVIIFLSGIHNPPVSAFFGHARWLGEHGYASILVEMRAHGESEGEVITLGHKEYLDVQAAVDHITASQAYAGLPIVVYGVSMGGATAINAIGQTPEIDGLVTLSAYSSWGDVFGDSMIAMGAPGWLVAMERPFVAAYSALKFGFGAAQITPKKEIAKLGDRPALLMHSRGDSQVPFASFDRLMASAPDHVETWVVEGDQHFITPAFEHPEEDAAYAETVLGFLEEHFGR